MIQFTARIKSFSLLNFVKIFPGFFLHNPANKQTDRQTDKQTKQTNADENLTSLEKLTR